MGDCKSCKSASACGKLQAKAARPVAMPRTNMPHQYELFERPPAHRTDATPLNALCTCDEPIKGHKRYQCLECIKSYVRAVGYKQARADAVEIAKVSQVGAERLDRIADELEHGRRLTPED